ncbi:MAG: bifunctional 4-hydroxy-2-oxoglutarate aldolase/2-dehydro-3-deoxy-phosphogluconate aldolase [Burkholderiales bacterium]|jgi:2-dehydro-3-deoxyphosphogluconate aldolase/(4S)-4-hydroxy-2-oxoglutarate aldolase|uniref:bifunctional 4-hydroxy-2-oxoglutarate aldolase/2-dehydro-3-deoxy-phosphogluconate aldolase n=1 Tax=Janthinobacterium sp. B9-8 TaxID=1236179 RepID=UPI00061CECCC|nr:bifunctional 4-hydroxy-2-oxoglutarate aldolase/2-dehydro-3-deoxy-phosphogluconate aldolase [Janthinobacterium sp. B9-8]AMC33270.1 keto-deoxy-phosphogluconate aldolase [Janthinobacterium sp. B9-8]MBY0445393.1 bifunctional 4-hydroxy-2-oxoglutarate aldolase/2-dehydro-3-deoxy-phosphogluconate aldolase [Burkholderiales bacterium]MCX7204514.1 bifunctional 4-hydroxy-2-oxoglutarate aldolase/2-dehydro-3-deoxy-phosphogluconate aldolase [Pseudomonadota bacterium]
MQIREIMRSCPVMPVLVIEKVEHAVPLAKALVEGGICVLEVTLRTDAALAAVRAIVDNVPGAIVGVGTVVRPEQFAEAKAAGAVFAVTPGLTPKLAAAARAADIQLLPGVMTPSEAIAALEEGFDALKLFPAEQAGSIGMLKAMGGPLPQILFCPTGGVSPESAPKLLAMPNVGCVGGSWLAPKEMVAAGDWAGITALARAAAAFRK